MIRQYKIQKHNSTVCGYPGRDFDWSKFDWEGKSVYKGILKGDKDIEAPEPFVDDYFIGDNNQYLHVPYNFTEHCIIYRVRPNDSMCAGEIYRRCLVVSTKAIKKTDGWYWELELTPVGGK